LFYYNYSYLFWHLCQGNFIALGVHYDVHQRVVCIHNYIISNVRTLWNALIFFLKRTSIKLFGWPLLSIYNVQSLLLQAYMKYEVHNIRKLINCLKKRNPYILQNFDYMPVQRVQRLSYSGRKLWNRRILISNWKWTGAQRWCLKTKTKNIPYSLVVRGETETYKQSLQIYIRLL
jgi:hypothetical protein